MSSVSALSDNCLRQVWCRTLLFVIGNETRALASMIEAAALIGEGRRVVLVMNDVRAGSVIDGSIISESEAKDLNRGRAYLNEVASSHHVAVFSSIADACQHVVVRTNEDQAREQELRKMKQHLRRASTNSFRSPSSAERERERERNSASPSGDRDRDRDRFGGGGGLTPISSSGSSSGSLSSPTTLRELQASSPPARAAGGSGFRSRPHRQTLPPLQGS